MTSGILDSISENERKRQEVRESYKSNRSSRNETSARLDIRSNVRERVMPLNVKPY